LKIRVTYSPKIVLSQQGLARRVVKVWVPGDGFHLVVQRALTKILQERFENLSFVSILSANLLMGNADIFHLHIIADAANLDEESLKVDCDLFLHSFGELATALLSVTGIFSDP
jgi:hypothetical protein